MKLFKQHLASTARKQLNEAPRYKLYHDTLASAFQTALADARKQGYEVSDEEEFQKITTARKPYAGETESYTLEVSRHGKVEKNKRLHIQIYRIENSGKYELNCYVS